jgi:hypothetical protein
MRIAQIAPLAESVPPKLYGGTERVVAWLVDELVSLGHEVTLFASGDSRARGNLHPVWPRALRLGRPAADPAAACTALLEAFAQRVADFDVVHSHIDWLHLPLLSRPGVPFLTTMHGRLDLPGLSEVVRQFADAPFVSISDNQRLPLAGANWRGTVHHGLPADLFRPSYGQGPISPSWGASPPRKDRKAQSASRALPECSFASRPSCLAAKGTISRSGSNRKSTARRSGSSAK